MERVTDTPNTIEVFENDIELHLQLFCEENDIKTMKTEPQSVWNSCLRYIHNHVFKHNKDVLKSHVNLDIPNHVGATNYNAYNYDLVLQLVDFYAYDLCMKYNKEVSIIGFSALTGIDQDTIYQWGNNPGKTSHTSLVVYKKLCALREESLSNKLADGRQNPVGVIAILNRQFGWASPYVSDSSRQTRTLTAADLPRLGKPDQVVEAIEVVSTGNNAQ